MLNIPHRRGLATILDLGRRLCPAILLATLILALAPAAPAPGAVAPAAVDLPGAAVPPPPPVFLDPDAKPAFDWNMPNRFDASWAAWNSATNNYFRPFVNPTFWGINLDACASTSLRRIKSYSFAIAQVGTTYKRTFESTLCRLSLLDTLPALGQYTVTLTLRTDYGSVGEGVSAPLRKTATLRDYLIVSIGDSLASGEGNPDVPGSYGFSVDEDLNPVNIEERRRVQWKDRRCHRSAKSGPALAAKAFEDADPKTSVTFLSVACSGAKMRHLITDPYEGIEPSGGVKVRPQIDVVADLIAATEFRGPRRIDALLVTAGLNDLKFSDIIMRCALNNNLYAGHESCVTDGDIATSLEDVTRQYAYLAASIRVKLANTREVYVTNYPGGVFRNGGCGLLGLKGVNSRLGIDAIEGNTMQQWGDRLDRKITEAALAYRSDEYRWNKVYDLAGPFLPHAYCDSVRWFTTLEGSLGTQGNVEGTAHPNTAGHVAFGNLLRRAINPNQGLTPYRQVTVSIDEVKVSAISGAPALTVDATLWEYQSPAVPRRNYFTIPQNGHWTPIPDNLRRFTFDVFVEPASPRHTVALDLMIEHILPIGHTRSDGYGAGSHEVTHPTGRISARYHVETQAPGPPGPAIG